jgi:hypothetical protein
MDGYTFPIQTLRLIRWTDKDAKGLGGHDRSGTPVQPRGEDVPGNPCITVVRGSRSAGFARLVPPEKQVLFIRTSSGLSVEPPASGTGPDARPENLSPEILNSFHHAYGSVSKLTV